MSRRYIPVRTIFKQQTRRIFLASLYRTSINNGASECADLGRPSTTNLRSLVLDGSSLGGDGADYGKDSQRQRYVQRL